MMPVVILTAPVAAIIVIRFLKSTKAMNLTCLFAFIAMISASIVLTVDVVSKGSYAFNFPVKLYFDSLNIIILDLVVLVGLLTVIYSFGYTAYEENHSADKENHSSYKENHPADNGNHSAYKEIRSADKDSHSADKENHPALAFKKIRLFYSLLMIFVFTMLFSLSVLNMGLSWVGIEATTLASVFLVGLDNNKKSLEAAWKYIMICSVGIALAFLGIVFLHISSQELVKGTPFELSFTFLTENAGSLKKEMLALSFIFILAGYGTKAGLAPMHTWLPDAHSQAPSPVSALLSGVLLNCAMYGIMREYAIVNKGIGGNFAGNIMIASGLLSMLTAALFIMTQKDYKRLLAYSSIEHMGLLSLGLGIAGPSALFASLLHMINHSFAKSMLFFSAGNVYIKFGTREIRKINGLFKSMPFTAIVFFGGLLAISGVPPFSVFASELGILTEAFRFSPYIAAFVLLLLALIFAGFTVNMFRMFFGEPEQNGEKPIDTGNCTRKNTREPNKAGAAVCLFMLILMAIMGLFIPKEIAGLVKEAAEIIGVW